MKIIIMIKLQKILVDGAEEESKQSKDAVKWINTFVKQHRRTIERNVKMKKSTCGACSVRANKNK